MPVSIYAWLGAAVVAGAAFLSRSKSAEASGGGVARAAGVAVSDLRRVYRAGPVSAGTTADNLRPTTVVPSNAQIEQQCGTDVLNTRAWARNVCETAPGKWDGKACEDAQAKNRDVFNRVVESARAGRAQCLENLKRYCDDDPKAYNYDGPCRELLSDYSPQYKGPEGWRGPPPGWVPPPEEPGGISFKRVFLGMKGMV